MKTYLITMYENEWVENDSFGIRHYLKRVVVKSQDKVDFMGIEEIVLNQFNEYRREEELVEYNSNEVSFEIIDLEETETINVDSLEEENKQ